MVTENHNHLTPERIIMLFTKKKTLQIICFALLNISVSVFAKPVVDIQAWSTSQGVPVFLVESHQLPMVDGQIIFSAGSAFDEEKPGVAALTNTMLDEGTENLTADEIAQGFEQVGAIYSSGVTRDSGQLSFRSLSKKEYIAVVGDLISEILGAPQFRQKDFDRMKDHTVTALQYDEQQPSSVAARVFFETLYGSSPYGHQTLGSLDTVKLLTPEDVKAFYQQYYVRENAKIILVGDLTRDKATELAEKLVSKLPSGQKAVLQPSYNQIEEKTGRVVPFPSTQTTAYIGQVGISRSSPDYFSLKVGNNVLGGGDFNSRLMKKVRVDKGLAYYAASTVLPLKDKGPFIIMLQTRNNKAKQAITIAHKTLEDFVKNGPNEEELELAKQNIIGSFPQAIASNSAIMGNVANIAFYELPLDYLDTFRDRINAVTAEKVQGAFQRMLALDKLVTVTVGNQKT